MSEHFGENISDQEGKNTLPEEQENSVQAEQLQTEGNSLGDGSQEEVQAENKQEAAASEEKTAASEEKTAVTYSWVSPKLNREHSENTEEKQERWNTWSDSGNRDGGAQAAEEKSAYTERKIPRSIPETGTSERRGKTAGSDQITGSAGKKAGSGRRWAVTAASAAVFGLVAGLVFTGVAAAGNRLTAASAREPVEVASTEETASKPAAVENTSDSQTGTPAAAGGTVADVAAQCMPSLVTISTISVEEMQSFFGQTQQYEVEGAGTGVIVGQNDTELLIATNNHVVSGASSLSVGFLDETAVSGAVKGYDASTDLAVVAVKLDDISKDTMDQIRICEMGDSDALVLGEQVVAIGNALGYGQSVTSGYISAFNRELNLSDGSYSFTSSGLIQTDASINSGNSGGALLNMKGQLIGINEAKSSGSGSSSEASVDNIGFAIPIAKAEPILENLMSMETRSVVSDEDAAFIGITCADVSQETTEMYNMPTGVCVTSVMEGSPAEEAGLKKGDVLTAFDGRNVSTYAELTDTLKYYPAGETVELTVYRSDEGEYSERTITITLGSKADLADSESGEEAGGSQRNESRQESGGRGWSRP